MAAKKLEIQVKTKGVDKSSKDFDRMRVKTEGIERAVGQLRNKLLLFKFALGATVAVMAKFGKESIDSASSMEKWALSFEVMTGSIQKGAAALKELQLFEQTTTLQLPDIIQNAKQLKAMGIEGNDLIKIMKALGDVSFGLDVPLGRLALNLGQVRSQGRLTGREIRDFAMAGVPLLDELAKNLNKTADEIKDMVSAGKIGFKDVENAFVTMTSEGGKFANIMAKGVETFAGQVSLYQTEVFKFKAAVGEVLIPTAIAAMNAFKNIFKIEGETTESAKVQLEFLENFKTLSEEARLAEVTRISKIINYNKELITDLETTTDAYDSMIDNPGDLMVFGKNITYITSKTKEQREAAENLNETELALISTYREQNIELNKLLALTANVEPAKTTEKKIEFETSIRMLPFDTEGAKAAAAAEADAEKRKLEYIKNRRQAETDYSSFYIENTMTAEELFYESQDRKLDKLDEFYELGITSEEEYAELKKAISDKTNEYETDLTKSAVKLKMQGIADAAGMAFNSMGSALSAYGDMWKAQQQNEIDTLKHTSKYQKATAEERINMEQKVTDKYKDSKKRQWILEKAFNIAKIGIDTASAVVEALPNIPLSVLIGALGAAQLGMVLATPAPKFHSGGDFIVPPGYPNDSFPIMVESGERVQVTPSSETGNSDNSETNDLLRALLAKPVANTVVFDDVSMSQYVDRGRKNRNSNIL